eukprot:3803576-Pyramimonas_sp.AAC.1
MASTGGGKLPIQSRFLGLATESPAFILTAHSGSRAPMAAHMALRPSLACQIPGYRGGKEVR